MPLSEDSLTALAISRLLWDFQYEAWRYSKREEMETLTGIVMLKQPKSIQDIKTLRIFASGLLSQWFSEDSLERLTLSWWAAVVGLVGVVQPVLRRVPYRKPQENLSEAGDLYLTLSCAF